MPKPRIFLRAFAFGVTAEAIALAVSFGLYSLKHGREPMEPPFNWAATVLQMPGIFVCDMAARSMSVYTGWFQWGLVYCVQALLWSIIALGLLFCRTRKTI